MIDLEDRLSAFLKHAPEAPPAAAVMRRAKQRRRRRLGAALTTLLLVIAVGVSGVLAAVAHSPSHRVRITGPGPSAASDTIRMTLLDGSQLSIGGPASLGLTTLTPTFNGELDPVAPPQYGVGHTFSVERTAPSEPGAVVGRYPTHDGHEMVVSTTPNGVDAVVQYESWALVVTWGHDPTDWATFAAALNAKQSADGYLVVDPVDSTWHLGPGDGPDLQLVDGTGGGASATFSFFGPANYPAGCPTAAETSTSTPQGWGVAVGRGASWCDASAKVRVIVSDPAFVDTAVRGLRVAYTDPAHEVDRITTLDGSTFAITAPASVLDQLALQTAVYVDGLTTPNILNETPNALPVSATREGLPSAATTPSYPTGDGHRLYSYVEPGECQCAELVGTYGDWLVKIEVDDMSVAQRTLVASLVTAHQTADGFLVLEPRAPMHFTPGPGAEIVLDRVEISTSSSDGLRVIGLDDSTKQLVDQVHVRRIGSVP